MISSTSLNTSSSLEGLISQYMAIERRPLVQLQTRRSAVYSKTQYFDSLKTKLQSLQNLAEELKDTESDSIFNTVTVTSSNESAITVSADDGAAEGTYNIRVRQLATSTQIKSTGQLNSAIATTSSSQVVAGLDELSVSNSFTEAGFDTEPSGSISINGQTFDLADYDTITDFMLAVNNDTTANVNIYYDANKDKFIIENDDHNAATLTLAETAGATGVGFFTAVNIETGTFGEAPNKTPSATGLQADVLLYKANFDSALAETDTGSFKINGVTIDWDAGEDTLNEIIARINSSDTNVTAFYDDSLDKVMITAKEAGSEDIQFEDVEGTFLSDTLKFAGVVQNTGNDAKFTINSTDSTDEITKTSNTFEINGVSVTLNDVTVENDNYTDPDTEAVVLTSTKNLDAIENKIQSFLNSYNTILSYIKQLTDVDISSYTRGVFTGESVINSLRYDLIHLLTSQISTASSGDPTSLSQIGITFDENLSIEISDPSQLEEYLTTDPRAVSTIFNATDGIATSVYELLEPYIETDGIIDDRTESIADHVETIDQSIDRMEDRLEIREEHYRTQLQTMQSLLYQVVQQQNLMNSILSSTQQYL